TGASWQACARPEIAHPARARKSAKDVRAGGTATAGKTATGGWRRPRAPAPAGMSDKPHVAPKTRRTEEVHQTRGIILIGPSCTRKCRESGAIPVVLIRGRGLGLTMKNNSGGERRSGAVLRAALM